MEILIGADPEVFVAEKKSGALTSGYNLIPGTKEHPHLVDLGAVQVDGMALEFNIAPADSSAAFLNNINTVVGQLAAMVPDHELQFIPVANFGKEYIQAQPKEAKELGCNPDFDAWTGKENVPPDAETPFRTASGHLHIGWTEGEDIEDEGHRQDAFDVVKALDATLGMYSLLLDPDKKRRKLYGKAGACRVKPYGVEYRVLSNFWLRDPDLIKLVYKVSHTVITALAEVQDIEKAIDTYGENVLWAYDYRLKSAQQIINEGDAKAARKFLKERGWKVTAHEWRAWVNEE